jgi:hypothetical protein
MKNLWLHCIYISIIGVLGFQLWAKTDVSKQAFHQVDSVLESNNSFLSNTSEYLFDDIKREFSTNPEKYGHLINKGDTIVKTAESTTTFLEQQIMRSNKGKELNSLMIKDTLQAFSRNLNKIADSDSTTLLGKSQINKLMNNDTFWTSFKDNQATYLSLIKNQVKLDEIWYLNYINDKVSRKFEIRCSFGYKVAIAPKKVVLVEGETFEADIYLVEYYKNYGSMLTFTVENENLPINEGVAHCSKKENTTGLKKINVKATVRNPATGESTTAISEFEYHVLPKCSQNCQ